MLFKVLEDEFPGQVDKKLATFSVTSAETGLRHEAVVDFSRHVVITDGELDLSATTEELAMLAAPVRAPTICSRVTSTPNGIGQSAKRAREEGGHFQKKAAGEPGSKRRKIAWKSVFFKSEASADAPYVAHTRLLPFGGIGFMAHTVRSDEKMGSRHGIQHVLPSGGSDHGSSSCGAAAADDDPHAPPELPTTQSTAVSVLLAGRHHETRATAGAAAVAASGGGDDGNEHKRQRRAGPAAAETASPEMT